MARTPVDVRDETANRLIDAALSLIDEGLADINALDPSRWARKQNSSLMPLFARLTARAVCTRAGTSYTMALTKRWPDTMDFIGDVLRRGMVTAHSNGTTWIQLAQLAGNRMMVELAEGKPPAQACIPAVDDLLSFLLTSPRALLPAHIAPYLPSLGPLGAELYGLLRESQLQWGDGVTQVVTAAHLTFREDWSPQAVVDAVQALLDGWLVKRWTDPGSVPIRAVGDPTPSFFARSIEALAVGALVPSSRWA